jgi:exosortase
MLALGYAPMLVLGVPALLARSQPVAIPIAVLAGLALAWRASRQLGPLEPGAQSWSITLLGLAVMSLVVAGIAAWPWLGAISAMITFLAAAYAIGGASLLWAVLPAWVFVALIVLPAMEMEFWLVGILQLFVTACAGPVMDALGIIHLTEGNVIKVTSGPILGDQACGGILSLYAAMEVTLFGALWTGQKLASTATLVLASAFWVVLCNIVRVVTVVFAHERFGLDLTSGWKHDIWGIAILVAVMMLTLSTSHLLRLIASISTIRLFVPKVCAKGSDVRLLYSVKSVNEIPQGGRSKIIVAVVDHLLHFRIIGSEGLSVVDTDETRLQEKAPRIAHLRKQLDGLWPPHVLTDAEKVRIISLVTSIVDHNGERSLLGSGSTAKKWSPTGHSAAGNLAPTEFSGIGQTWLASRWLGSVFVILGLAQVVWLWPLLARTAHANSIAFPSKSSARGIESLNEGDLPEHLGPYVRAGFETKSHRNANSFGEFSREWHYRADRSIAIAAVDFPFRGWHESTYCYTNNGWYVKEREAHSGGAEAAGAGAFVESVFVRSPLGHAILICGFDDMHGNELKPPQTTDPFRMSEKLDIFRFARGRLAGATNLADQSLIDGYQVRLLIQTSAPLSADQRKEARAVFARLRQAVRHRGPSGNLAVAKGGST